jgi:hypothetical protein
MAYGIVCEEVQDHLLTDCYENINNRKYTNILHPPSPVVINHRYVGKFVDYRHQECEETFHLLHIIGDFTEDSNGTLIRLICTKC